jgi:hypothetical protein
LASTQPSKALDFRELIEQEFEGLEEFVEFEEEEEEEEEEGEEEDDDDEDEDDGEN